MEKCATPFTDTVEDHKIQRGMGGKGTVIGLVIEGHSRKKVLMLKVSKNRNKQSRH